MNRMKAQNVDYSNKHPYYPLAFLNGHMLIYRNLGEGYIFPILDEENRRVFTYLKKNVHGASEFYVYLQPFKTKRMKRTKVLGLLLVFAGMSMNMFAQKVNEVKNFEFEVKLGANYPLEKLVGDSRVGPELGIEARWNFNKLPIDVGLEVNFNSAVRKFGSENLSNRIFSTMIVADYNLNRGGKFSPFVGVGMGVGNCQQIQGNYGNEGSKIAVMPRIGVECMRHLRLTLDARFAMKGYNTVGLTVGYAFGGGLRK